MTKCVVTKCVWTKCVLTMCGDKVCGDKVCVDKCVVTKCGGGRRRRRRRSPGYRIKNKNPTRRCGEKQQKPWFMNGVFSGVNMNGGCDGTGDGVCFNDFSCRRWWR